jgi:hypothetical protein
MYLSALSSSVKFAEESPNYRACIDQLLTTCYPIGERRAAQTLNESVVAEISANQKGPMAQLGLTEGSTLFTVNNMMLEADKVNLFSLLTLLKSEAGEPSCDPHLLFSVVFMCTVCACVYGAEPPGMLQLVELPSGVKTNSRPSAPLGLYPRSRPLVPPALPSATSISDSRPAAREWKLTIMH